ncbi:MAG TPA: DUF4333 domain-containing protein [Actinomycetota bacterium]|nr:DUF4333 domain-containing protein [Actinomycetota bacterium]
MSRSTIRAGLAASAVAALLAGCTFSATLGTEDLEAQIREELQRQTGVVASSVECPDDVPAEVGTTFTCTARADDGSQATITATVEEGANIRWEVTSTS